MTESPTATHNGIGLMPSDARDPVFSRAPGQSEWWCVPRFPLCTVWRTHLRQIPTGRGRRHVSTRRRSCRAGLVATHFVMVTVSGRQATSPGAGQRVDPPHT